MGCARVFFFFFILRIFRVPRVTNQSMIASFQLFLEIKEEEEEDNLGIAFSFP